MHGGGGASNLFHEEEILGKAFDWPLVKRLLGFAKPYAVLIVICVVLILMTVSYTHLTLPTN